VLFSLITDLALAFWDFASRLLMMMKGDSRRDHLVLLFAMMFVLSILVSAAPVHAAAVITTSSTTAATQYEVVFAQDPSGAGSTEPSGNVVYDAGSSISISATASSGYVFSGWGVSNSSL